MDTSVPSAFLIFNVPCQVMLMSIALPSVCRLASAGSCLMTYAFTICCAALRDFASSPWSQLMSTPSMLGTFLGLTNSFATW